MAYNKLMQFLLVILISLYLAIAAKIDYGEFEQYMVPWEKEIETDDGMPEPTIEMIMESQEIKARNTTNTTFLDLIVAEKKNVLDLSEYELRLVEISNSVGVGMLERLVNFSLSFD